MLLDAYYCENTIINYFVRRLATWVIPSIGKMNWFSEGGNSVSDSGGSPGEKMPTSCTTSCPPRQPGPQRSPYPSSSRNPLEYPRRTGFSMTRGHPNKTPSEGGFIFPFYKEEISGRLMHVNHLLVEKNFKRQGLLSQIIILG